MPPALQLSTSTIAALKYSLWLLLVCLSCPGPLAAGEFSNNFDSGLPAGTKIYGDALIDPRGGVDKSGVVKLTRAQPNLAGSFLIQPLDGDSAIREFTASFKAFVGGGTAGNGFTFYFSPHLPNDRFDEATVRSGLIVTFDSSEDAGEPGTGLRVRFGNTNLATVPFARLRANRFVDVLIRWNATSGIEVAYNNNLLVSGLQLPGASELKGRFGFSASTGTSTDWHCVDDLLITTRPALPRFLLHCAPADDNAAPDAPIEFIVRDAATVNLSTLQLTLDGRIVKPVLVTNSIGQVQFQYQPPSLLEPGSSHAVTIRYSEVGNLPETRQFRYQFSVNPHIVISK